MNYTSKALGTVLLLISSYTANAQWDWINPYPTGNKLNAVVFSDSSTAWAVGSSGTLIRSDDAGCSWNLVSLAQVSDLNDVRFINQNLGYIAGDDGLLLKTTDAGETWQEQNFSQEKNLVKVQFINPERGWILCGEDFIYATIDGGQNFERYDLPTQDTLNDMYFTDSLAGIVVCNDGLIFRTVDGGQTWIEKESGTGEDLHSVQFPDNLHGWIAGPTNYLLFTENGGVTWSQKWLGGYDITTTDVFFTNGQYGWATGIRDNCSFFIRTIDGGSHWYGQDYCYEGLINSLVFKDSQAGTGVGDYGAIYRTANAGSDWNRINPMAFSRFLSVYCTDKFHVWIGGDDDYIYTSNDEGLSWQSFWHWYNGVAELQFLDTLVGWAVSQYPADYSSYLERTNDGGENWYVKYYSSHAYGLWDAYFIDHNNGWLVGMEGLIANTKNGGNTWTNQDANTNKTLKTVFFCDSLNGWVAGSESAIFRTKNGGNTWISQFYGYNYNFNSSYFINPSTGWLIGENGFILHTNNYGDTWEPQNSGTYNNLRSVIFTDEIEGWIAGDGGTLLKTDDAGESWIKQELGTDVNFYKISFSSDGSGWLVGENGAILHKHNGGWVNLDEEREQIEEKPVVKVYPNPASKNVNIFFSLPEVGTIELYSISGTLLKEMMIEKGRHSASLNVSGLSPGIYLLRLQSGNNSVSRKLFID